MQQSHSRRLTDEKNERDVSDDERHDDVAQHPGDEHRQQADHRQNRIQTEIVLVVQLHTHISLGRTTRTMKRTWTQ